MNLAVWLERAGLASPAQPAVMLGTEAVADYGTLARRAASIAAGLRRVHGLEIGDRVAIVAKNDPAYLEILFGAWWGGFVVVPINVKLHAAEVAWAVRDCGAKAVFAAAGGEAALGAEDLGEVRSLIPIGSGEYRELVGGSGPGCVRRGPDDLAWIFYTSGTTGRPKGAMLTHANLAATTMSYLAEIDPTGPGDCLLHGAPMSHGSGLYCMSHVCRRGVNAFPESAGFDAAEALALSAALPSVSMFAAPTMIQRLVDADRGDGDFRTLVWGGAPMHPSQVIRALDRFGPCLAQIYGQGESPMTISYLGKDVVADRDHPRWMERLGSAGVPHAVVEVAIAKPGGAGEEGLGEVLVRGATVMRGYWQNQAASEAALADGWLHTGDIGRFDEDGFLTLVDRSKDVIISGGSNIYPREVEDVLLAHPGVEEAAVIGRPDDEWGEIVVAFVVGDADEAAMDSACIEQIARFKRPKAYLRLSALPRNSTGKVLRGKLRELDSGAS